jgi:hypothetical protein
MHVPLEYWGMLYYSVVFLSYLVFLIFPEVTVHRMFVFGIALATAFAFLFSIYLTAIQTLVLKHFCSWCLASAGLCTIIFSAVVQSAFFDVIPFLQNFSPILLAMHLLGVTIGFGGAIITDIFFFKFLKDARISENEEGILKTFSQVIWLGLGIIVVSGILIFISNIEYYSSSAKFLTKMFVVGVIIINGFFLNKVVTPSLTAISFGKLKDNTDSRVRYLRHLSFALGAVSVTSWWTAFILGNMRSSPAPLPVLLGIYILALVCAVVSSQIVEKVITSQRASPAEDIV